MTTIMRRLGGLSAATLGPAATSLLAVPVLVRAVGQDEWASIAVGQAAGTIAGILVGLGWGFNGPTVVARADPAGRSVIAVDSLTARVTVAPFVIVAACVVAAVLRPDHAAVAVISCLGVALLGLGMTWFFIGAGNVRSLLTLDAVPRMLSTAVGCGAAWLTGSGLAFAVITLVGALVSVVVSGLATASGSAVGVDRSRVLGAVRTQLFASITVITAASYLSLPTLVVAALSPDAVFVYALADRLTRLTFLGIAPLYQWMQAWVPAAADAWAIRERIRRAIWLSAATAVVLGVAIVGLAPVGARILGGSAAVLEWNLTVPLAVSVAMSALSRCFGMVCLLALGDDRTVAVSAVLGAVCGVPLLLGLVPLAGAAGAATAVMLSEIVVTGVQAVRLRRRLSSPITTAIVREAAS
ncbi:polysaccharide biosynthesis C-terminal domain-containing protein [Rhodococcus kroppenstedtii]|uniref:polysaccharide biosynthesis C-terminal domain-containing protein n=1 Tax=Rhodococcoides kroppenstedtii TaxID=293050 RepID=UPI001C9B472E|nr:polysaccharide biosynthesis C-terminal domain-containing protein [Rhodococcus kroppenstedtii]MBY6437549.1 polysaccharide biosynthesis C-terminal domain-containing protein [Rhodococcus kroppenstedtii]